jgi:hypothetical protein
VSADVAGKDLILVKTGVPAYTVSGTITTSDEAGAAGAVVQLEQNGTAIGSPVTTGTNGTYTISGVPAGEYTIAVSLSGYESGTIPAFTVSADVTGKDLVLQKIIVDTTPPARVTVLTGTPGDGQVTLSWTDPADTDLASIEITWAPGGTAARTVAKSTAANRANTTTISGLTNGTEYTFTVGAVDTTGNKGETETVKATPVDATPPAEVTGLTGTPGNGGIRLNWTDPADADLASVEITWEPGGGSTTAVKSTATDRANYKVITGLVNATEYTFTVKAKDAAGNQNAGETVKSTPDASANTDLEPPAGVTGLTGAPGNAEVILSWTDPADTDLASIEITWEPGNGSTSAAKSAAPDRANTTTISGLTNGTAYTFTVKAVDNATPTANKSIGVTSAVTPHAAAQVKVQFTGLPQDETITLDMTDTSLSHAANIPITVTVSSSFIAYRWYLDGALISGETSDTLTGNTGNLTVKRHELTVFVTTSGGVEYAKAVTFTVTP